jgi:hypothetical protein
MLDVPPRNFANEPKNDPGASRKGGGVFEKNLLHPNKKRGQMCF